MPSNANKSNNNNDKLVVITLRISQEEKEQAEELAQELNVSRSWVIRQALHEYLDTH